MGWKSLREGGVILNKEHLTEQIHSDVKKRRSFVTLLFSAGDLRVSGDKPKIIGHGLNNDNRNLRTGRINCLNSISGLDGIRPEEAYAPLGATDSNRASC